LVAESAIEAPFRLLDGCVWPNARTRSRRQSINLIPQTASS
jgi:hypothetical protein